MKIVAFLLCTVLAIRPFAVSAQTPPPIHHYIKVKELRRKLLNGERLTILDARSSYAYKMERIKDAISLPLAEVKFRIDSFHLSKETPVVTYCSCPHHIAEMAADVLKELGYSNVSVLDEGIPGWKKLGYPLSGELANKPLTIFWLIGYVCGPFHKPAPDTEVRVYQPQTEQLEIDKTGKDGFYATPLHFYGLKPGDQLQASLGRDTIFLTVGKKTNPWGTRIDDEESHLGIKDNEFIKTFKSRKLHP